MELKLRSLEFQNFRSFRHKTITFFANTLISGPNESGKSTVYDGWLWLLFGKDQFSRQDFEIKTLDENNEPLKGLEHSVRGVLVKDGRQFTLHRVYKEKYDKKQGNPIPVFTGHTTKFFIDDVPKSEGDYNKFISQLMDEKLFRLLVSPKYFVGLKPDERRNMLLQIAGDIDTDEIIATIRSEVNPEHLQRLIDELNAGKKFQDFKAQVYSQSKKIQEELDLIPERIKEANMAIGDPVDYEMIQAEIDAYTTKRDKVDILLTSKTTAEKERQQKAQKLQQDIFGAKSGIQQAEFSIKAKFTEAKSGRQQAIRQDKQEIRSIESDIAILQTKNVNRAMYRDNAAKQQADYKEKWIEANKKVFEFNEDLSCPVCKQPLPADNIERQKEEMLVSFNLEKSQKLADLNAKGKEAAGQKNAQQTLINEGEAEIKVLEQKKADLQAKVAAAEAQDLKESGSEEILMQQKIDEDKGIIALEAKVLVLEGELSELNKTANSREPDAELILEKRQYNEKIVALNITLGGKESRDKQVLRVETLAQQIVTMSEQLTEMQGIAHAMDLFDRAKMDTLEKRVNGMFHYVRFRLFKKLVSGDMEPCCDPLINGVPFAVANTAAQINAGLDIINVFSSFYKTYVPIFIDNAESVNTLMQTKSQITAIYVTPPGTPFVVKEINM